MPVGESTMLMWRKPMKL
jgi:hypothetical protein